MRVNEDVLSYLDINRHRFVSGDELMKSFSLSRTALWQILRSLRSAGYVILSEHGVGYRLDDTCDVYTQKALQAHLSGNAKNFQLQLYPSIPSTNRALKEMAQKGAPAGTLLLANRQTAGYGRKDRTFFSPRGGIYLSLLVRPDLSAAKALTLTTTAAVAVVDVIKQLTGQTAQIKWVNDIFLNGKKICGILTESALTPDGRLEYAVIGIGLNVFTPSGGFHSSIRHIAGAIYPENTPMERQRSTIALAIIHRLADLLPKCDSPTMHAAYCKASFLPGRTVTVMQENGSERLAVALGIDDDYRLLVRYAGGECEALFSGEVSVKEGNVVGNQREIPTNSKIPLDK
jgi:BirA family biotin operon repressor/biotin-[acetyl-CoA-carboxylase] ligase